MPPKVSSSRPRRSKQPITQPRRGIASSTASTATDSPSTRTRSKTKSKANPPSTQAASKTKTPSSRTKSATSAPTPPSRTGTANTSTPSRRSAACTPSAPSTSTRTSRASYTPQIEIITASPRVATQPEMDVYIESELHNAIFHDPNFVERFLSGATEKLRDIEEHCCVNNQHYERTREWPMPERVPDEPVLHEPILDILNTIKRAVDHVYPPSPSPVAGVPAEPPQLFVNGHKSTIPSDLADAALIKPDLVLLEAARSGTTDLASAAAAKRFRGRYYNSN